TSYQAVRNQTDTPKRYRYTGKERDDENDLYYYGARYYVSWLGRWISCDPSGFADGTNLYQFARSNPVANRDAYGTAADSTTQAWIDPTAPSKTENAEQRSSSKDRFTSVAPSSFNQAALTSNVLRYEAAEAIRPQDISGQPLQGTYFLWSGTENEAAARAAAARGGWLMEQTRQHVPADSRYAIALLRESPPRFPATSFSDQDLRALARTGELRLADDAMQAIWDPPSAEVSWQATLGQLPVQQNLTSPPGPGTVQARIEIPTVRKAGAIVGGFQV